MNRAISATGWVRNPDGTLGYTLNPMSGCLNRTPEGLCLGGMFPCYAYKLANGRLRSRYLANENIAPSFMDINHILDANYRQESGYADPFYPRLWEDRFVEADKFLKSAKKPLGIFPCDMSDWCGIGIPYEWSNLLYSFTLMHKRHRFYLLTKQSQNLIKFSPFPEHCYVGVTVTNADMLFDAINHLDDIQCRVRFLSIEPMLQSCHLVDLDLHLGSSVDWVIIGALTSKNHSDLVPLHTSLGLDIEKYGSIWTLQPKIEWVQEIALACTKAHIPLFLKDNLKPLLPSRMPFWAVYQWQQPDKGAIITMAENRYRQEMPKVVQHG